VSGTLTLVAQDSVALGKSRFCSTLRSLSARVQLRRGRPRGIRLSGVRVLVDVRTAVMTGNWREDVWLRHIVHCCGWRGALGPARASSVCRLGEAWTLLVFLQSISTLEWNASFFSVTPSSHSMNSSSVLHSRLRGPGARFINGADPIFFPSTNLLAQVRGYEPPRLHFAGCGDLEIAMRMPS
jgi:hypothetical protein